MLTCGFVTLIVLMVSFFNISRLFRPLWPTGKLTFFLFVLPLCVSGCANRAVVTSTYPQVLLSKDDFVFDGGLFLPDVQSGDSSVNWTEGVIEAHDGTIYLVGNEQEDAIAQFAIPVDLPYSSSIDSLPVAGTFVQSYTTMLDKLPANRDNVDSIVGLEHYQGRLIANAIEYYDGPADNRETTFVIEQADSLADSKVSGLYSMAGKTRAAGWLSAVPNDWQQQLGCTHISGSSSGGPIIGRYSVGPSAFCIDLESLGAQSLRKTISTRELLGFDLSYPLHEDLYNESLQNDLWTHLSRATYGFIVPGTATYATFGNSGGHRSGVGYKLPRGDGVDCSGYCAVDPADNHNYYWFWDVRELWRVALGRKAASSIRPYEWGQWDVPLSSTTDNQYKRIGGASYDASRQRLYFTLLDTKYDAERGVNPPAIIGYRIRGLEN